MKVEVNIPEDAFLPVFKPLRETTAKLKFSYGGRDGGKSNDAAKRKIVKCLSKKYFRCILTKKTFNTIKESQWQTIKDVCEDWQIAQFFDFHSSPLEIRCKLNGNRFICRGMDDPANIKSISNPTDAWVEEGNQLEEEDFIYLMTTLRSNEGDVDIDFTFNPETETDFRQHWLYKNYFSHTSELSFENEHVFKANGIEHRVRYVAVHSTYHDNKYVTAQRKAIHESLQSVNPYWYRVFTLGLWGNKEKKGLFAICFSREKHVSPVELFPNREHYLYLSFDFNRNPACCSVIQYYNDTKYIIETIKLHNSGTDEICEYIKQFYPDYIYIVTGDYSGNTPNEYLADKQTGYTIIAQKLNLNQNQFRLTPNPRLEANRTAYNYYLKYGNTQMCPVKAQAMIYDHENVEVRADGKIIKEDREDPAQQADALDTSRYWDNAILPDFFKIPEY